MSYGSQYEFWLTDDSGRRISLLKDIAFSTINRSIKNYGYIQLGLPYDAYVSSVARVWQPDWRIDAWRSPGKNFPKRREGSFFLRKCRIYDRTSDSTRMMEFYGRNPWDILRRWTVVNQILSYQKKETYIDDMMKEIVTESFISPVARVVPAGELTVDADVSLGPITEHTFYGDVVLDILKDLKATSFTKNFEDPTKRRILFDVVEGDLLSNGGFGYIFRTYADIRGIDRTKTAIFSQENENMRATAYIEDYLDEATEAQVGETVVSSDDQYLSRWNRILVYQSTTSPTGAGRTTTCDKLLYENGKKQFVNATFIDTMGGGVKPRSLYGIDWNLGDLLRVQYAQKYFNVEVESVSVSINEAGEENIIGMNSSSEGGSI